MAVLQLITFLRITLAIVQQLTPPLAPAAEACRGSSASPARSAGRAASSPPPSCPGPTEFLIGHNSRRTSASIDPGPRSLPPPPPSSTAPAWAASPLRRDVLVDGGCPRPPRAARRQDVRQPLRISTIRIITASSPAPIPATAPYTVPIKTDRRRRQPDPQRNPPARDAPDHAVSAPAHPSPGPSTAAMLPQLLPLPPVVHPPTPHSPRMS